MKGSGVDEWPCMTLVCVFRYILVHIHWDAHQTFFFVRKSGGGGGGESPSKFFGNTDLKNFKNYGRPLK